MTDRLPWFPLDVGEYLASTSHLSAEEHGVYMLLQMHYWINNGLPTDERSLAKISRISLKKWKGMRETIVAFFGDDWRSHERLNADMNKARKIQMQRRLAGAKGGFHSSVSRAKNDPKLPLLHRPIAVANAEANASCLLKRSDTHSQSHIETTSEQDPAREVSDAVSVGPSVTRPADVSKQDLEAMYARRRLGK